MNQITLFVLYGMSVGIMILIFAVVELKHSRDHYMQQVAILNEGIELQNAKIEEFKSQSDMLNKQLEDTQNISNLNLQSSLQKDSSVLNQQVPSDCEGSMQWLKQQAMEMNHESR